MSQALNRRFFVEEEFASPNKVENSWTNQVENSSNACVIQCPHCQTKFSLPVNALQGHDDPRFHCSQCDTIFRVESDDSSAAAPPPAMERNEPSAASIPDTFVSNAFEEALEPQVMSIEASYVQPTPSIQGPSTQGPSTQSLSTPSRSFEIPRAVDTNWTFGAPHESAPEAVEPQTPPSVTSSSAFSNSMSWETESSWKEEPMKAAPQAQQFTPPKPAAPAVDLLEPKQMSLELQSSSASQTSPDQSRSNEIRQGDFDIPQSSVSSRFPSFSRKKTPAASTAKKGEVSIQKRQLLLESVKRIRIPLPGAKWQGWMVVGIPLCAFCLGLCCLSMMLRINPLQSEEVITSIIPGIPRVAPPGIAVIDAHLKKLTLDSGDTIYALSGHVKNNSGKKLNQVHLDGLVFDRSGKILMEKKVIVSSPLAQSKIKALSLEMIEDIEANASRGKTVVKDGDTAPFVVTFQPQEVTGAKFFSTRIHSVK